jgi:hypothetical protein
VLSHSRRLDNVRIVFATPWGVGGQFGLANTSSELGTQRYIPDLDSRIVHHSRDEVPHASLQHNRRQVQGRVSNLIGYCQRRAVAEANGQCSWLQIWRRSVWTGRWDASDGGSEEISEDSVLIKYHSACSP